MNKTLSAFAFGALLGSLVTYGYFKTKVEEQHEEEISIIREQYERKLEKIKDKVEDRTGDETEKKVFNGVNKIDISSLALDRDDYEKIVDYSRYSKPDKEEVKPVEDEAEAIAPSEGLADMPYSITASQFANEYGYFDKVTLLYYEGDGVLVTEDEEDITSTASDLVGPYYETAIGEFEDGVGYIRNEQTSTDYEILEQKGKFYSYNEE